MDHVKTFHTGMMMSDVLHERQIQMQHMKKKKEHQQEIERMWERTEQANLDAHDEVMKAKLIEEFKRKQETALVIKDQVHQVKVKAIKEYQDGKKEAALIMRQASIEEENKR